MMVILTLLMSTVLAQVSQADQENADRLECIKLHSERKICGEWTWNAETKTCNLTEHAECLRRVRALSACRDRQLAYSLAFDAIYGNSCPPLTVDLDSGVCKYECDLREARTTNGSYVFTQSHKCAPLREIAAGPQPTRACLPLSSIEKADMDALCDGHTKVSRSAEAAMSRLALLAATWVVLNSNKQ